MEFVNNKYLVDVNRILAADYLDAKSLFWSINGQLPNLYTLYQIDKEKIYKYLLDKYKLEIDQVLESHSYNNLLKRKKKDIEEIIFVFNNKSVLKICFSYCDIFYSNDNQAWIEKLKDACLVFREVQKKNEFEINLISYNGKGFELRDIEIKKTKLDIKQYYNDDFIEIDKTIRQRLNTKNDKGIVLLHGLPGTGKTTYLRNLIGKVKKRVLFVPPSVANNITNPEFMNLLIENPNSILIIEDAENIIMDREMYGSSSVSNLLNISDGLLADCLNTQIICTFNMPISKIDNALLRKGRLIAKYNFGKLNIEKAQALAVKKKLNIQVNEPMSLAELFNVNETNYENARRINVIGFASQYA